MLGIREPNIYGKETYHDLCKYLKDIANNMKVKIKIFQSNSEGEIIDVIHQAYFRKYSGIIINAGAYTHYSYAIYDAIKSVNIKTIEVHLTDISSRDEFRKKSVIREACIESFSGKHFESYKEAIEFLKGE
jgi:3-dehydroquinate dehydratase-2